MKTAIKIVIDREKMTGVYEGKPGYVNIYDFEGNLVHRRGATEQEALQEHWIQRLEQAIAALRPPTFVAAGTETGRFKESS